VLLEYFEDDVLAVILLQCDLLEGFSGHNLHMGYLLSWLGREHHLLLVVQKAGDELIQVLFDRIQKYIALALKCVRAFR